MRLTVLAPLLYVAAVGAATVPRSLHGRDGGWCQSDMHCDPMFEMKEYCDKETKTCKAFVDKGGKCTANNECRTKLCSPEGICRDAVGDKCEDWRDCKGSGSYICSPRDNTCLAGRLKEGEACSINSQCRFGRCSNGACKSCGGNFSNCDITCENQTECEEVDPGDMYKRRPFYCDMNSHQCQRALSNGNECKTDESCKSGACVSGKCQEANFGTPCQTPSDCKGRSFCEPTTNTCLSFALLRGSDCVADGQCSTGYCSPTGKCDHKPGSKFATCSADEECTEGRICRKTQFIDEKVCWEDDGTDHAPCSEEKKCAQGYVCKGGECTYQPDTCKPVGLPCASNSSCCSKSCKPTEIIFLWQCA